MAHTVTNLYNGDCCCGLCCGERPGDTLCVEFSITSSLECPGFPEKVRLHREFDGSANPMKSWIGSAGIGCGCIDVTVSCNQEDGWSVRVSLRGTIWGFTLTSGQLVVNCDPFTMNGTAMPGAMMSGLLGLCCGCFEGEASVSIEVSVTEVTGSASGSPVGGCPDGEDCTGTGEGEECWCGDTPGVPAVLPIKVTIHLSEPLFYNGSFRSDFVLCGTAVWQGILGRYELSATLPYCSYPSSPGFPPEGHTMSFLALLSCDYPCLMHAVLRPRYTTSALNPTLTTGGPSDPTGTATRTYTRTPISITQECNPTCITINAAASPDTGPWTLGTADIVVDIGACAEPCVQTETVDDCVGSATASASSSRFPPGFAIMSTPAMSALWRRFVSYCGEVSSSPFGGQTSWSFVNAENSVWIGENAASSCASVLDVSTHPLATWTISDGAGNAAVYEATDFVWNGATEFVLKSFVGLPGWSSKAVIRLGACT